MRVRRACVAVAAASALFAAGCGIGGDKKEGLGAGDYTVTSVGDVTNSVVVNGHISPIRSMSITSPVQSKVQRLAVAVGDRVEAGQFLAEMDTEALEREIANQQRQQAAAQAEAMQGYEQAQAQLAAHTQQVRNGTHPAISAARAQVAQAQAEVAAANGQAPQEGAQATAPVAGRAPVEMVLASNERGQTVGIAPAEAGEAAPSQGQTQGQAPQQAEGQAPEQAYSDLQAADGQLQAAQAQAAQESQQLQAQAEGAWQQAQSAGSAGTDDSLEYQVQQSTIYAPIGGVISSVDVQEGDVPQGRILTIADDSRLLIRSEVREADVPNIKAGDRVKFTSTATGSKEYTGKVGRIAPVGSAGGQQNSQQGANSGGGGSVTFPIEIEVEGDKEGLLLGGTVRAEIITAEEPGALSVPRDAVYDSNKVLVLSTGEGEDAKQGTVEERTVTTGAANEVDIAVTGGDLKPGDIVINWPDEYRDRLGQTVGIDDPKFDPAEVDKARDTAKDAPAQSPESAPAPAPAPAAEQNQ